MAHSKQFLKSLLVFRPGDRAVVANPVVVTRVGYPLALDDVRKELGEKYRNEIAAFIESVGLTGAAQLHDKVLNAIARAEMVERNFGGRERTLHTQVVEGLRGNEVNIIDRKVVKTGVYRRGCVVGGWDFGEEYDPPELRDINSHVLVEVYDARHCIPDPFWIETINLRKTYDAATGINLDIDGKPTPF